MMKYLVSTVGILFSIVMISAFVSEHAYAESQIASTEQGTLDVKLEYDTIVPNQNTAISVEFLNPLTKSTQVHIDYAFTITRDGEQVFGPTSRIHTSPGIISIPIMFTSEGVHSISFTVDGILFQPIPPEMVSFDIVVGGGDENDEMESVAVIPDWIKNNAEWWAQDLIDDATFVGALQYLIENDILIVPLSDQSNNTEITNTEIPDWIKNNAEWWAQDLIDDATFVGALQYLIEQGIIQVS